MELPTPRTMPWLLLLCLAVLATGGVLQALAQSNSGGFISIDCGLDDDNTLSYTTDAGFIDTYAGSNHNVSVEYIFPLIAKTWYTVRSFPSGTRNCYTLGSLVAGLKYLIRAKFFYGNNDGLGMLPIFDLFAGVDFWGTVNFTESDPVVFAEVIVVVPRDSVQVCLVNTGGGVPFISGLDLRPLKNKLYPQANAMQALVLVYRINFGPTNGSAIRYPDDPYDRLWFPFADQRADWAKIVGINLASEAGFSASRQNRSAKSEDLEALWSYCRKPDGPTYLSHLGCEVACVKSQQPSCWTVRLSASGVAT